MGITITDYVEVRERASRLGLNLTSDFAILPRGFQNAISDADLAHEAEASTVRKLFGSAGVEIQQVQLTDRSLPSVVEKAADWVSPIIFIGGMLLSDNPYAVQVALGVLDSYISDLLKGNLGEETVKLTFVVERDEARICSRVDYEGPRAGLKDLAETLREVHRGSRP